MTASMLVLLALCYRSNEGKGNAVIMQKQKRARKRAYTVSIGSAAALFAASLSGTAFAADPDAPLEVSVCQQGCQFQTIQEGIDAVAAGGTVNVEAGTYDGVIAITKSLHLRGPQTGFSANGTDPLVAVDRGDEAILTSTESIDQSDDGYIPLIALSPQLGLDEATDITISGFTFDLDEADGVQHFIATTPASFNPGSLNVHGSINIEDNIFQNLNVGPVQGLIWLQAWNGAVDLRIRDNRFADLPSAEHLASNGIRIGFPNPTFDIANNVWLDGGAWAMNVSGRASGTISGNWVGNTDDSGASWGDSFKQSGFLFATTDIEDLTIEDNHFVNPFYRAIALEYGSVKPDLTSFVLRNNTFDGFSEDLTESVHGLISAGTAPAEGNVVGNTFLNLPDGISVIGGSTPGWIMPDNCWSQLPRQFVFPEGTVYTPWCVITGEGEANGEGQSVPAGETGAGTLEFLGVAGQDAIPGTPSVTWSGAGEDTGWAVINVFPKDSPEFAGEVAEIPFDTDADAVAYSDISVQESAPGWLQGPFTVCMHTENEAYRLWHLEEAEGEAQWVDITGRVLSGEELAAEDGKVCGQVESLSPFALAPIAEVEVLPTIPSLDEQSFAFSPSTLVAGEDGLVTATLRGQVKDWSETAESEGYRVEISLQQETTKNTSSAQPIDAVVAADGSFTMEFEGLKAGTYTAVGNLYQEQELVSGPALATLEVKPYQPETEGEEKPGGGAGTEVPEGKPGGGQQPGESAGTETGEGTTQGAGGALAQTGTTSLLLVAWVVALIGSGAIMCLVSRRSSIR